MNMTMNQNFQGGIQMDNIEKARSRLINYINDTGKSQAVISKKIGLSPATISQFLNDSYSGDNEEIAMMIDSFLYLQEMRKSYTKAPDFTDSLKNTRKIINTLDYVYANKCTGVVSGVSGCGKTTALKNYQKMMNGVIYIQADATKWSPYSILKLIAKSIDNNLCKGSASDILDNLIEKLTGVDKLIIIDEAQHLKAKAFDTLRVLNDRAEIGVVYAGTPDIIQRMTIGRAKEEFDQVYSRIEYTCNLSNRFKIKEITALFDAFNLDNTVIKCLCNAASQKGDLRYAINLFKVVNSAENGKITVTAIEEAMKRVGKGVQFK